MTSISPTLHNTPSYTTRYTRVLVNGFTLASTSSAEFPSTISCKKQNKQKHTQRQNNYDRDTRKDADEEEEESRGIIGSMDKSLVSDSINFVSVPRFTQVVV